MKEKDFEDMTFEERMKDIDEMAYNTGEWLKKHGFFTKIIGSPDDDRFIRIACELDESGFEYETEFIDIQIEGQKPFLRVILNGQDLDTSDITDCIRQIYEDHGVMYESDEEDEDEETGFEDDSP